MSLSMSSEFVTCLLFTFPADDGGKVWRVSDYAVILWVEFVDIPLILRTQDLLTSMMLDHMGATRTSKDVPANIDHSRPLAFVVSRVVNTFRAWHPSKVAFATW